MLGKFEGASGFFGWHASDLKFSDVPKPFFGIRGVRNPSPFSEPRAYWAHQPPCGGGEQIPQVSVIMLLISGNVHGASLKPPELI